MVNSLFETYRPAINAALEASQAILEIYVEDFKEQRKEDGSPVTIADLTSSDIINKHLEKTNIPIIGEENEHAPYEERRLWSKAWCVDPLDGTKEFLKKNDEFVVNIALIEDRVAVFGLIASPVNGEVIVGGKAFGAYQFSFENAMNPEKWRKLPRIVEVEDRITLISSRSHYAGNFLKLVKQIERNYGPISSEKMGSALKFFELVSNKADVYPRLAPTMEWDIAAGQAIYEAVGGEVLDVITGEPLRYNKKDLRNPYFIASKQAMHIDLNFYTPGE